MAHSLEDRNFKLRKRKENVFTGKPEASNTFLIKWKTIYDSFLKPVIVKNRRRVDFYTHVVATTLEDSSSRRRIWRYGERSFPSMRTASFRGFFTSGRRSRGRRSDLLQLPIVKLATVNDLIDTQFQINASDITNAPLYADKIDLDAPYENYYKILRLRKGDQNHSIHSDSCFYNKQGFVYFILFNVKFKVWID